MQHFVMGNKHIKENSNDKKFTLADMYMRKNNI